MRRKTLHSFEEGSSEEALINLTPLIDVVFVVLITFIVLSPLLEVDSVQLSTASSTPKDSASKNSPHFTLSVHSDDTIWFEKQRLSLAQLRPFLQTRQKNHPSKRVQLLQDERAHFGTYQAVKNALEEAGFEHLDILLKPH